MTVLSPHFELRQVAAGVYAALATDEGAAHSNAGIVDLGDRTLVFDTFLTPAAAQDLQRAAVELAGRPAAYVANSHAHTDHWWGNQAFTSAVIVSSAEVRRLMEAEADQVRQLQADPAPLSERIGQERARLQTEPDPGWRAALEAIILQEEHELAALPMLTPRLPDQSFEGRLLFYGSQRTAELVHVGAAHTSSDAMLLLPAEGVVFLGDLGFFAAQPLFSPDCDHRAWAAFLERMACGDADILVPGHGPVGTKEDLGRQRQYMAALEEMVARMVAAGAPADEVARQPIPAPFASWEDPWAVVILENNLRFLHRQAASSGPSSRE